MPEKLIPETHEKVLSVRSFYICIDKKVVSYTGVVCKTITKYLLADEKRTINFVWVNRKRTVDLKTKLRTKYQFYEQ
ncbi:hypothetical protein [Bacillus cereus]|uniref:hypothetical protein n=1 Tax=Bacillus cereus TaxID=1396 RepID=UPI001926C89F|nr:hypothetical protein [Bacillus cereus]